MWKYILLTLLLIPSIAQAQLNVVVVFDGSGSMNDRFSHDKSVTKIHAAKKVLIQSLNGLPADTKIGVVVFSRDLDGWAYELGPIDKDKLANAINTIKAGGDTPLGKYTKEAANALLKLRQKQKYGIYKLIIVTDGESSDDIKTPLVGKYGILSKGLLVEVIGVDMDETHTLATKVPYRSAKNPNELINAVRATLAEVSNKHSEEYDLIAPLDPKLALAALQALNEYDNYPIGLKPVIDNNGNVIEHENVNEQSSNSGWLWIIIGVITVFIVIIGIIVISLMN